MPMNTKPRPRKCATCREAFTPQRMGQKACSPSCALQLATSARLKKERREEVAEKKEHLQRKKDAKPLSHWLSLTQDAMNEYVRTRDAHLPCVSCGTMTSAIWDAGHFYSRGSRPNLRFDPLNIHKQCAKCNRFASADVQAAYRAEIERRIGVDMLQALERDHEPRKWTREALEDLRAYYREKTRSLKASAQGLPGDNGAQLGSVIV